MDSTDLTREQCERLHETMGRLFRYFQQLERRLESLQFDRGDKFFRLVFEANDLMHSLSVTTHYMAVGRGCGQSPRKDAEPMLLWHELGKISEPESE